jgi:hypothetical protein
MEMNEHYFREEEFGRYEVVIMLRSVNGEIVGVCGVDFEVSCPRGDKKLERF